MQTLIEQSPAGNRFDERDAYSSVPPLAADPRGITRRPDPNHRSGRRVHFLDRLRVAKAIRDEQRCERALIKLHFEI